MFGIIVAAVGLALSQSTGDPRFDGAASIIIGAILGLTAWLLAVESKQLLIGESADRETIDGLRGLVLGRSGITGVGEVLTVHSSPDQITAMMSVDFDDGISAREVEDIIAAIEAEARAHWPLVKRLYVRPQRGAGTVEELSTLGG
jgi:divalent metal cation (Fe/Co/Zn/Cd) transporter